MTCLDCGAEIDSLFAYQYATLAGFGRRPICESCYTRVVTGAAVRSPSPYSLDSVFAFRYGLFPVDLYGKK